MFIKIAYKLKGKKIRSWILMNQKNKTQTFLILFMSFILLSGNWLH